MVWPHQVQKFAVQRLFAVMHPLHPVISKLYNDAWVRPDETEGITHKEKVEGGSYW